MKDKLFDELMTTDRGWCDEDFGKGVTWEKIGSSMRDSVLGNEDADKGLLISRTSRNDSKQQLSVSAVKGGLKVTYFEHETVGGYGQITCSYSMQPKEREEQPTVSQMMEAESTQEKRVVSLSLALKATRHFYHHGEMDPSQTWVREI